MDSNSINLEEIKRKHLLSDEWFMLNENQFGLYKLLFETLVARNRQYWTAYSLTYRDDVIRFFSLLNYFMEHRTSPKPLKKSPF